MTPSVSLEVKNLRCERGERPLFADLNFALHAGEVLWLRGRNGRGKTSLLRCLAGLSEPAAGEIFWHGRAARESGAEGRRALLHLGHANALKEDLTVAESLRFVSRLNGPPQANETHTGLGDVRPSVRPNATQDAAVDAAWHATLDAALARLGLPGFAHRAIRTLSQGQRRRVALARLALGVAARAKLPATGAVAGTAAAGSALPAEPAGARRHALAPLWLLDEPFDALDDDGVARLAGLITEHAAAGGSVLFTSHLAVPALGPALRGLELDALPSPHDEIGV
jgi:heme exporter protein A